MQIYIDKAIEGSDEYSGLFSCFYFLFYVILTLALVGSKKFAVVNSACSGGAIGRFPI
jgi:hypothetical protein